MNPDPQDQPTQDGSGQALSEFDVSSAPGNEREAAERVAAMVRQIVPHPARLARLKTAVAEAVLNAMEHGNQYRPDSPVRVCVSASKEALTVRITDQGTGAPVERLQEPDLTAKLAGEQSTRGWGLFLIRQMTDEMHVLSSEGEHTVELLWYLDKTDESGMI